MDFAKKQLEKYGWKEGEGLGKNKTGISKAIKPKLKFDTGGLGHDLFEDIHNTWWQKVYDQAASNIVSKTTENGSVVLVTIDEITKKKKKKRKTENLYKDFVKISELSNSIEKRVVDEEEDPKLKKEKEKKMTSGICDLTDEELFRACGGRTAHKGARHGVKMNAKLARIEQQELSLLQKSILKEDEVDVHHKKKKRKKSDVS